MATLIVPDLQGSGPEHWQSWFEQQLAARNEVCVSVEQGNWNETYFGAVISSILERQGISMQTRASARAVGMATFENLRCTQSGLPLGTLDTRLASDVAVRRKEPGRNKRAAFNWTNYLGDTS